jgi:hypothetical protein
METTICSGPFGSSPKLVSFFGSDFCRLEGATLTLRLGIGAAGEYQSPYHP